MMSVMLFVVVVAVDGRSSLGLLRALVAFLLVLLGGVAGECTLAGTREAPLP